MATTSEYLTQLQTDKQTLVSKLTEKGVKASNSETFTELVPKVGNIETGITPTGEITIEENGTYDITQYASAEVNVPSETYAPKYITFKNYEGTNLDYETQNVDTSRMTDMSNMFYSCNNVTSLDLSGFNTSNVTNMRQMFNGCNAITSLDLSNFNTSKVTTIQEMFYFDSQLKTINLNGVDFTNISNAKDFLYGLSKLVDLTFGNGFGAKFESQDTNNNYQALTLQMSSQLSHASLMDIINKLYDLNLTFDVASGGTLYTKQVKLGSTNLAKLTAEEIAIATSKGWTVS